MIDDLVIMISFVYLQDAKIAKKIGFCKFEGVGGLPTPSNAASGEAFYLENWLTPCLGWPGAHCFAWCALFGFGLLLRLVCAWPGAHCFGLAGCALFWVGLVRIVLGWPGAHCFAWPVALCLCLAGCALFWVGLVRIVCAWPGAHCLGCVLLRRGG
jgi:hypothetical protein